METIPGLRVIVKSNNAEIQHDQPPQATMALSTPKAKEKAPQPNMAANEQLKMSRDLYFVI